MLHLNRCEWANRGELEIDYHDTEWGVPVHDGRLLFEFLILEGAQAGLSWSTILRKRAAFREAFDNFDAGKIARYDEKKIQKLLNNSGIIRNRLKIVSAVNNARAFLRVSEEVGSFEGHLWRFVGGKPIQNGWKSMKDIPSKTRESDALSQDLRQRGFTFVGSTICYAFMQAVGMVNDHITSCFRYAIVARMCEGKQRRPGDGQELES